MTLPVLIPLLLIAFTLGLAAGGALIIMADRRSSRR